MVTATIREQILSDLDRLSPEQQRQAAEFVRTLASPLPRDASVEGSGSSSMRLCSPSSSSVQNLGPRRPLRHAAIAGYLECLQPHDEPIPPAPQQSGRRSGAARLPCC